jgi:hypothetical protein
MGGRYAQKIPDTLFFESHKALVQWRCLSPSHTTGMRVNGQEQWYERQNQDR